MRTYAKSKKSIFTATYCKNFHEIAIICSEANMSDIPNVLEKLEGTSIYDVLVQIEKDVV